MGTRMRRRPSGVTRAAPQRTTSGFPVSSQVPSTRLGPKAKKSAKPRIAAGDRRGIRWSPKEEHVRTSHASDKAAEPSKRTNVQSRAPPGRRQEVPRAVVRRAHLRWRTLCMTKPAFHPIEALRAKVPLSRPGDPGYAAATSIWARPSGPGPVAVAHCRTAADVREAVRAARKHGLPLSVRAGGHDWAGRAPGTGVVIDLTPMRAVIVEEDRSAVRMGGGTLARDLFPVTDPIGRAVVTGTVGAVGMGGFTLGGGYGALIGRFGLALDNLLSAEVVLADGSFVVANDRSNPELFWALRGGGGNFGVVTG